MKFAAPYKLDFNCPIDYENIDEFNINFTEYSSFEELRKFIKLYPSHRINIEFSKEKYNSENIINVCSDFDNVYVRIHQWEIPYLKSYEEKGVKYFFDNSMPIYSYSLLEWALMQKTTGIYITDDLTYNLEEVYKQCNNQNIELRIILNRLPSMNSLVSTCPTVQAYRPQDYNFLSKYYAVGEFDCGEKYDWNKAEVLYQRWFIDHYWSDDLNFLNQDINIPYPTESIPPELTRIRSFCRHRCTMSAENICSKCRRFVLLGYRNKNNNLVYTDPENGLPSLEEMVDSIIVSKNNNVE